MRVLILSISTGQGHHQCAKALSEYLQQQGVECNTVDALEYFNSFLSDSVSQGYLLSTQYSPLAYGKIYRLAEKKDKPAGKISLSHLTTAPLAGKMAKLIRQYKPHAIVCTHVYTATLISAISDITAMTIGIITDFTVHPFWEDTSLDYYVTASDQLAHMAYKKHIYKEQILPLGIPIATKFSKKLNKQEARRQLKLKDKMTVFIMSGSMGYGNLIKHIKKLDKLPFDFQILSVCGRNNKMKKMIDNFEGVKEIHNFGYVDNIDLIMDASDVMFTKPGGLSVSEGLSKGIPMVLMDPIPGQEDRNAEFLINNGVALLMSSTFPADECLYQLLESPWRLGHITEAAKNLGKPNAAKDLGDFIIEHSDSLPC